uniref:Nucleotide-diphospho-sugar transferase domain-containing protein n=1 Tax=Alexandrium monilatum TaxID=311494 RepID=A0A7S4T421_9DINO
MALRAAPGLGAAALGCCWWFGAGGASGSGAASAPAKGQEERRVFHDGRHTEGGHGPFRCGGFFTVLATEWEHDETCAEAFANHLPRLKVLSAQMVDFGTRLIVFTTRLGGDRLDARCRPVLPGIEVADFNSSALLARHGFSQSLVSVIRTWRFQARKQLRADIFRLCLAWETGLSYVDTDILFLAPTPDPFLEEYVAAIVWASSQASLEITNAAFCLGPRVLDRMIAGVRDTIERKGRDQEYFYTELGSHIFQRSVLNNGRIRVLSHNHPEHWDTPRLAAQYRDYGHLQLHLTGAIRQFSADKGREGYAALVQRVRRDLDLEPLRLL